MRAEGNSTAIVYARAEEAKNARSNLQPIPSFELYKGARQEELLCYRSLCRAFCMHNGNRLTKQQTRVLEDVREVLCIPSQRADAEMFGALEDVFVSSVAASGVLKRRGDFFDGVADVPLDALRDGEMARDDKGSLYGPPTKVSRVEQTSDNTAAATSAQQRRGSSTKSSQAALLKTIEKIGQEVSTMGRKLLYAVSATEQQTYRRALQAKREQLKLLLKEVEGNHVDVSGNSSVMPSEHGC